QHYDGLNRLIDSTTYDHNDVVVSSGTFSYDDAGNLRTHTTIMSTGGQGAPNRLTRFEYDAAHRQTRVIDPLYHATTTRYDAVGNVLSTIDALGEATRYSYDGLNRVTRKTEPDPDGPNVDDRPSSTTDYLYDSVGNTTKVTDSLLNVTTYEY